MYCQVSGGDCELQNAAYHEGMTHWPLSPNYQPFSVDASNPYFVLDHNRCILCRRCVRACSELIGNFTLGFEERGAKSFLVADFGVPLGQSSCISCGSCVQVCPTGAFIDRESAYRGRDTQVDHVHTICIGCSVGCGIDVMSRGNRLVRIDGDWDTPVSDGVLCKKGRYIPVNEERERLVTPLVRRNGTLRATTWDDALNTIASKIKASPSENGGDIAAIASTRLPAEALSSFKQLFSDHLHNEMVTSTEEGINTIGSHQISKETTKPFESRLESLDKSDCFILVGADLINDHEVVSFFIKRRLPTGTHLVVIGSQDNPLSSLTRTSLTVSKEKQTEFLLGLAAAIVKLGMAKSQPTVDLAKYSLDYVSQKTGIPNDSLVNLANIIGSSHSPCFIIGDELTTSTSTSALKALLELAHVMSGQEDNKPSILGIKGQANSLTASLYNLEKPFHLNGHQVVFLALGDDTPSQKLVKEIDKAPFVVVQASYVSPVTSKADVVLPVEIWSEQEGHYINFEGRVQFATKAISAPDGVHSNVVAITDLANRLGINLSPDWESQLSSESSPIAIFSEN